MLSEKKIHKIGRIDQIVRDYFDAHPSQNEVAAKDLMALFIKKGIFKKDNKEGKPIRDFVPLGSPPHSYVLSKDPRHATQGLMPTHSAIP